jgi:hypothetical protein
MRQNLTGTSIADDDVRTWERRNAAALASLPSADGSPARHDIEVPLTYETARTSTASLADVGGSARDVDAIALVRRAFREHVVRVSTSLTETQRRAILLHLDGAGVVEISRQLGVNHSAVSRALFGSDDRVPVRVGAYEILSNALISDPIFLQEVHEMKKQQEQAPVQPQLMPTSAIAPAWFRKIHRGNIDQFGFFAVFLVLWSVSKDGKLAYSDACRTLPASIIGPTLDVLKRFPHRLVDFDGVTITIRGTPVDDVIAGTEGKSDGEA